MPPDQPRGYLQGIPQQTGCDIAATAILKPPLPLDQNLVQGGSQQGSQYLTTSPVQQPPLNPDQHHSYVQSGSQQGSLDLTSQGVLLLLKSPDSFYDSVIGLLPPNRHHGREQSVTQQGVRDKATTAVLQPPGPPDQHCDKFLAQVHASHINYSIRKTMTSMANRLGISYTQLCC